MVFLKFFGVVPQNWRNCAVRWRGEAKVLDAKTSGAVGYQWYVNGSAIEGATNATYAVAWRRGDPDTVSVVPYFDVFGVRTAGTPMSATVAHAPDGVYIIVR